MEQYVLPVVSDSKDQIPTSDALGYQVMGEHILQL
jgi:hypothetical protein